MNTNNPTNNLKILLKLKSRVLKKIKTFFKTLKTFLKKHSILIIIISIIIISLLIYFSHFNRGFSSNSSDWNNFSSFLNPFISISNLIIFFWLSKQVYDYNRDRDSKQTDFQKTLEKPILVCRTIIDKLGNDTWEVSNIGKGAAINILIAESRNKSKKVNIPIAKCYSLGSNCNLELDWLRAAILIYVIYSDIFDNRYISVTANDETHIRTLNSDYKEINIDQLIFNKHDFEKMEGFTKIRLADLKKKVIIPSATITTQTTNPDG